MSDTPVANQVIEVERDGRGVWKLPWVRIDHYDNGIEIKYRYLNAVYMPGLNSWNLYPMNSRRNIVSFHPLATVCGGENQEHEPIYRELLEQAGYVEKHTKKGAE